MTGFGGIYPDKLQEVEVPIVSTEVCKLAMDTVAEVSLKIIPF